MGKSIGIKANIPVIFLKEGDYVVAYTPALDLSTCGTNIREARKRFKEAVEIFLEESIKMGTLEEILLECGWKKKEGKKKPKWLPPTIIKEQYEEINIMNA